MRINLIVIIGLATIAAIAGLAACDTPSGEESDFNLIFKYGVTARNELNTFEGKYTRDMVADPPITIDLTLTEEELDRIYRKMIEIDFFDYPDKFSVSVPLGEPISIIRPYSSYYFRVEYESGIKELRWEDEIKNEDEKADRLRALIKLIRDIIESRAEYKELPKPKSGYM